MKSKRTTYILLTVVISVWGTIVWKVFSNKPSKIETRVAAVQMSPIIEQTDTLCLDYPDPFLKSMVNKTVEKPKKTVQTVQPAKPVKPEPPKKPVKHNLKYVGTITKKGVRFCLAEINGSLNTMKEREEIDGYELINIYGDSIRFSKDGEHLTIKLAE